MTEEKKPDVAESGSQAFKLSEEQLEKVAAGYTPSTEYRLKCTSGGCSWGTPWRPVAENLYALAHIHCQETAHPEYCIASEFR